MTAHTSKDETLTFRITLNQTKYRRVLSMSGNLQYSRVFN